MNTKEQIKVFIDWQNGKTLCICERSRKRCKKDCTPEIVYRDKFRGWQQMFKQDKFGKSKVR